MAPRIAIIGGASDGEEEAAAIAAVLAVLEAEAASATEPTAPHSSWHDTARMITQGLAPTRLPADPSWGHVERLRRAGRGGTGIVGQ